MSIEPVLSSVLLVSVHLYQGVEIDAHEFCLLAVSAGADVVEHWHLQRSRAEAQLFIGKGQAENIAQFVAENDIELVIFDQTLSPVQKRNLEQLIQVRVLDRTGLILDIFAQRARTYEGKLQVELAQLSYLSAQLIRGAGAFNRQKGGIGLRGPGETQLETDRRLLRMRMAQLRQKLDKVKQTRAQGRAARKKANLKTISLVGYTNAGKSTLFNVLTHDQVYAADQLFATLDPTLRRMEWSGIGGVVLADTVGFVQKLPHGLVEAFKATLEETLQADLLLHVIDSSNPEVLAQIEAVEQVLEEIGATQIKILRVYNKIDQTGEPERITYTARHVPERVYISAHTGQGMALLTQAVRECLEGKTQRIHLQLAPHQWKLRALLYPLNVIVDEQYSDQGDLQLVVEMSMKKLNMYGMKIGCNIDDLILSIE